MGRDFVNIDGMTEFDNVSKFLKKINFDEYETALGELYRKFKGRLLGQGTTRCVYRFSETEVIKVPLVSHCSDNIWHTFMVNIMEYLFYSRLHHVVPLAPCRLVFYKCVPLIIMDKVEVMDDGDALEHDWIEENSDSPLCDLHDGFQIGRLSNGKVVCYDYGYEGGIYATLSECHDLTEEETEALSTLEPKLESFGK